MRCINIRRIALSLGLGAAMTVLVAWRASLTFTLIPPDGVRTDVRDTRSIPVWPTSVPEDWPRVPTHQWIERWLLKETLTAGALGPAMSEVTPPLIESGHYEVDAERSGWPLRAFIRFKASIHNPLVSREVNLGTLRRGLVIPGSWRWGRYATLVRLPILPLWPGFAINTIFYGAFGFAAMAGASALRRRRRFKRGLCVQCAYPRTGGDICPECGTAVASAAKSPVPAAEPNGSTPV